MSFRTIVSTRAFIAAACLCAGASLGVGASRLLAAQQDGIKRTILVTTDNPGNAKYDVILGVAEIAPGVTTAKHRHNGIEVGYVLDGTGTLQYADRPQVNVKPGDAFKNEGAHSAKNTGKTPLKILAVYVVEKGKPIAENVP